MSDVGARLQRWLEEIRAESSSSRIGVFFTHNGVVRGTSREGLPVAALEISCDAERVSQLVAEAQAMPGVVAARAWVNEGTLAVGDDITCALVAGDVRKNVFEVWATLARRMKHEAMTQHEVVERRAL